MEVCATKDGRGIGRTCVAFMGYPLRGLVSAQLSLYRVSRAKKHAMVGEGCCEMSL